MATTPQPRRTPVTPDPTLAADSQAILDEFAKAIQDRFGDRAPWTREGDFTHLGTGSNRNYPERARPRPGAAGGDSRA